MVVVGVGGPLGWVKGVGQDYPPAGWVKGVGQGVGGVKGWVKGMVGEIREGPASWVKGRFFFWGGGQYPKPLPFVGCSFVESWPFASFLSILSNLAPVFPFFWTYCKIVVGAWLHFPWAGYQPVHTKRPNQWKGAAIWASRLCLAAHSNFGRQGAYKSLNAITTPLNPSIKSLCS